MERIKDMLKLRQITHRITVLSCWTAAFDIACAQHGEEEDEKPLQHLEGLRKAAHGALLELENSKNYYHRRLEKNNWDRGLNSAVEHAADQLREFDISDNSDYANITREAELLKSNAEREALTCIAEQDKSGDGMTVQTLLQAQFEALTGIENLLQFDDEDALEEGRNMLKSILNSGSAVASAIIKPDGSLAPQFSPEKPRVHKAKNRPSLFGMPTSSDLNAPIKIASNPPVISPVKTAPRRRKASGAKKSVSFSLKKEQGKTSKRSVRWKDDERHGVLTEIEKPMPDTIPEVNGEEGTILSDPAERDTAGQRDEASADGSDEQQAKSSERPSISRSIPIPTRMMSPADGSSPIPTPPEPTLAVQKGSNRFKTGFLSKKSGSSPLETAPVASVPLSDNDSPLRSIENSSFLNGERPSKIAVRTLSGSFGSSPPSDSGVIKDCDWKANKEDAIRISSAIRRVSGGSQRGGSMNQGNPIRVERRRSPTSSGSASPLEKTTMFTSSHARKMGRKEHEPRHSVLGARSVPVRKNSPQRRVTVGGDYRSRDRSLTSRDAIRLGIAKVRPAV